MFIAVCNSVRCAVCGVRHLNSCDVRSSMWQCVRLCGSAAVCGSVHGCLRRCHGCVRLLGIPYGLLYVKYGLIPREF
jgi:hypothetical protein